MAVIKQIANRFKFELGRGNIDFSDDYGDEFRVILMGTTFTFDRDNHEFYSDISANEISSGNGYTQLAKVLVTGIAWSQDDYDDKATLSWENAIWTATSGDLPATKGAVILRYDSDIAANSLILGYIDFGENITITDGVSFQLQDLGFDLEQGV